MLKKCLFPPDLVSARLCCTITMKVGSHSFNGSTENQAATDTKGAEVAENTDLDLVWVLQKAWALRPMLY
jgi:hypothetical protein